MRFHKTENANVVYAGRILTYLRLSAVLIVKNPDGEGYVCPKCYSFLMKMKKRKQRLITMTRFDNAIIGNDHPYSDTPKGKSKGKGTPFPKPQKPKGK